MLIDKGYQVLDARSGPEALRICAEHRNAIDLLVTDVVMPRMSGVELARRLKSEAPEVKVLFMSGYSGQEIVQRGILRAGVDFLPKPFTPGELAARVRQALDRR